MNLVLTRLLTLKRCVPFDLRYPCCRTATSALQVLTAVNDNTSPDVFTYRPEPLRLQKPFRKWRLYNRHFHFYFGAQSKKANTITRQNNHGSNLGSI